MRNAVILFVFAMLCLSGPYLAAQSRRVPPTNTNDKRNQRNTQPDPTPTPTEQPPVQDESEGIISVDTRLVSIPVRVLDRKNRFIAGLTKADFKVFDEGAEQEIAYFTNESQPFTVALVLDMSYSTTFKIEQIQAAALSFIDLLRPEDKVMVISFDEEVHMLCEATNDRKRLYGAIRSTRIATGTSLYEAVDLTMNSRLRSIQGRKAIVLFTDGVDTTSRKAYDRDNLRDALELDALIYPIRYDTFRDVQMMKNKPVINLPDNTPKIPPTNGPPKGPLPFPIPTTGAGVPDQKGTTPKEYEFAAEYLDQLALRTGGRVLEATSVDGMNNAFAKIASELREFYSIGYYPSEEPRPGQNRRIKVRVDRPGLAVRSRDSYVVAKK